jgi:two-component system, LytTR family, response regulator
VDDRRKALPQFYLGQMIGAREPDLLSLDAEQKDMPRLDVLRSVSQARRRAMIMVRAHEKHAVKMFGGGAVDYSPVPVGAAPPATASTKARERNESPLASVQRPLAANTMHNTHRQSTSHLMAENSHKLYFLAVEDIDYIEACGNYVLIHLGDQKYVRRDTIKRLALELRYVNFEWIRRSMLINLSRVAFAEKLEHGALAFTLASGTRLVSKNRVKLECTRMKHSDP